MKKIASIISEDLIAKKSLQQCQEIAKPLQIAGDSIVKLIETCKMKKAQNTLQW